MVRRRGGSLVALLAAAPAIFAVGCGIDGGGDRDGALAARQAEVAERGAEVMPFDLDATTHSFTKTDDGGVQVVVADDPDDADQIELIRSHLAEERDAFARGDFDDPAAIHGHDMEGVAELQAGFADVEIAYSERADGAALRYRTTDPALVDAIHAWFDRQVMDHGAHAEAG
jgi:hypothetical protein